VRKRERNRIARAEAPIADEVEVNVYTPKHSLFDLRVTLERRDGGKVQFTLHEFYGRLIGGTVNMKPKQFGRKLGQIFALWIKP